MSENIQPGLDQRTLRAIEEYHTVIEIAHGLFEVVSQSGKSYTVDLTEPACTCKDYQYRSEHLGKTGCKHLRRVRIEVGQVDIDELHAQLESTAKEFESEAKKLATKADEVEDTAQELHRTLNRLHEVAGR